MTVVAALLGAAVLAGVATPAAAATVTPSSCRAPQPLTAPVPVLVRPVVLVHGWTGKPMVDTAHALLAEPNLPIATYLFDYGQWSAHWVTDQHIAACLADYVHAVSDAYRQAGGDGRVIVVAHSMGGLAIRYATSARYVDHPVTSAQLGAVITFDTPELGSPFGNTAGGRVWETIQSHTNGIDLPAPGAGDGQICLAQHDHGQPLPNGCGQGPGDIPDPPPWLPAGIPLTEIAGDITVDRSLFGVHLYSVPLSSDGIVTTASSHGYPTSGPGGQASRGAGPVRDTTDACTTSTNAIEKAFFSSIAEGSPVGTGLFALGLGFTDYVTAQAVQRGDVTDPLVEAYFLGAALSAPCSHLKVAADQSAVNQATESIRTALAQLSGSVHPLTVRELPTPPFGLTNYITGGSYPQVTGDSGLDSVNAAVRALITDDEKQGRQEFVEWNTNYGPAPPSSGPGHYSSNPGRGVISASSAAVSALFVTTTILPGGNDGDHWVGITVLGQSAHHLALTDLFSNPQKGLDTVATDAKAQLLASSECVQQGMTDPVEHSFTVAALAPTAKNYESFALSPTGLTVGFDQGVLAIEACDTQVTTIPWSYLTHILSPGAQLLVTQLR